MRKLSVLIAALFALAVPVGSFAAAEHNKHVMNSAECIQECAHQSESLQKKIERIQKEIEAGSQKYSMEELRKLQRTLEEANETLDELYKR